MPFPKITFVVTLIFTGSFEVGNQLLPTISISPLDFSDLSLNITLDCSWKVVDNPLVFRSKLESHKIDLLSVIGYKILFLYGNQKF